MKQYWLNKVPNPKGPYRYISTEISDDESCLKENDFKEATHVVAYSEYEAALDRIKDLEGALEWARDQFEASDHFDTSSVIKYKDSLMYTTIVNVLNGKN